MKQLILFVLMVSSVGSWATDRAFIAGQLNVADSGCRKDNYQIFLSQDRQLIHQIEVPPNGTFSIDVKKGRYTLIAKNAGHCSIKEEVKIESLGEKKLTVSPVPSKRKPANELFSNCACIRSPCFCNGGGGFRVPSYIPPAPSYPWWTYSAPIYSNFFMPGPWTGWGLNPGFYPGGGHVGLAKPNVYVLSRRGPVDVNIKVTSLNPNYSWLATVPAYDTKIGWTAKTAGNSQLDSNGVRYPYFYYDMRTHEEPLQAKKGFCADRNEAVEKMAGILKSMGFIKNEIEDFNEHWKMKMPPNRVCVYPQSSEQMDKLVELKVSPSIATVTRMVFVVAYENGKNSKYTGKFKSPPEEPWVPEYKRAPAVLPSLSVHEWGVAFLFEE